MKFSFKKLAAAVILAAAATGASAAIDNGASGNGELFFSIWDANGSYTLDLNITQNDFTTLLSTGSFDMTFNLANDSVFTGFLSSADTASLQWNVMATDQSGARRILSTYSSLPDEATKTADVIRTAANVVGQFATSVNTVAAGADSVAVDAASEAYAGNPENYSNNLIGLLNFVNTGTLANNTYASGMNIMRIDAKASGIANTTYTQLYAGVNPVSLYIDANSTFHVAAMPVPEPESYAMLLAGLGMIGFMARRRLSNRA